MGAGQELEAEVSDERLYGVHGFCPIISTGGYVSRRIFTFFMLP